MGKGGASATVALPQKGQSLVGETVQGQTPCVARAATHHQPHCPAQGRESGRFYSVTPKFTSFPLTHCHPQDAFFPKSSHIPSVTSGCFSTERDKRVSMRQKTRGIEPFFPTITALLGIENVLGNTHRRRVWRKNRADPAHPGTNSSCLCLSLPILDQKINPLMGFISVGTAQREAPGLSCHLLPCPKPQGTDTKTNLRKETNIL